MIAIFWCILCVHSWPLALLVLLLWPGIWLLLLPFCLIGIAFEGVFALLWAIERFQPQAAILGYLRLAPLEIRKYGAYTSYTPRG